MNKSNNSRNFVQNPTKKTLWTFGLLWLIGTLLLVTAMTDLFTKNPFETKNIVLLLMIFCSTISTSYIFIKYYKQKSAQN